MPEGVALPPEAGTKLVTLAQSLNLKQEDAQRVATLGAEMAQEWSAQQVAAIEKAKAEWTAKSKADPEFGGEKLEANLAIAGNVFKTYGTPELATLLNDSGLGNHPEMIRWAHRVARAIGEDRFVGGQPPGQLPANAPLEERAAAKLYGNTPGPNKAAA